MSMAGRSLDGPRTVVPYEDEAFPQALREIPHPPASLYVLGNPDALDEGLAVVGARSATPYGLGCAQRFAGLAAQHGVTVISGGARGCDSAAHKAALEARGKTVVFCGGGCDWVYPASNFALFQQVVSEGGALVSEYPWDSHPEPYMFRARNRLIAGLSRATLIVEAGLPSGTFSTADEALAAGKEVWAVPGAITSGKSAGANRLIAQGATPIIDDEAFLASLFETFGVFRSPDEQVAEVVAAERLQRMPCACRPVIEAILAQPMKLEEVFRVAAQMMPGLEASHRREVVMSGLTQAEEAGLIGRYGDGKLGPIVLPTPMRQVC